MGKTLALFAGADASGKNNLWVTDGTTAGTSELNVAGAPANGLSPLQGFFVYGDKLLFDRYDNVGDFFNIDNLWAVDLNGLRTTEITAVSNAVNGLFPQDLTAFGGRVLFSGRDSSNNSNLWVTDGTASGTSELIVAGAYAGPTPNVFGGFGLDPSGLTVLGSHVLFDGMDSSGNQNLWITDGTAAGTSELAVVGASSSGLNPNGFTILGDKVLFAGSDGTNPFTELWVTDGTASGTSELRIPGSLPSGLAIFNLTAFGSKVAFSGFDANGAIGVWVSDGTATGTSEVMQLSDYPNNLTAFGNKLLFAATPFGTSAPSVPPTVWVTDGTAGGASELRVGTLASGPYPYFPYGFTVFGNKALFGGIDASGQENTWVTDGTDAGTSELNVFSPSDFSRFGNEVLFSGLDTSFHRNLWITDGTFAGTSELNVAGAPATGLNPSSITPFTPCFLRGSRVLTAQGEREVEELRVGDSVVTAGGKAAPVVWIGQRQVDCRHHPAPEKVWPVRIRAAAFGDDVPRRDLFLSPDHAVFCDGVLIPVKYLINGASIVQEATASAHYFHVELDRHDIVLAEGLAVESYLDTGNRAQFANGAAHLSLHPDFAPLTWDNACARLCTEGPPIPAVRSRLRERLIELSGLHVEARGRTIRPAAVKGRLFQFLLPANAREVRVVSHTGSSAVRDCAPRDCRTLGVPIGAILIDGRPIALDSLVLAEGFHPIEQVGAERWRWTNGAARLTLLEKPDISGPILLELLLCDAQPNWLASAAGIAVKKAA